jgi:hypothetical protein
MLKSSVFATEFVNDKPESDGEILLNSLFSSLSLHAHKKVREIIPI